ncbi:hypothetical protein llap_8945 [Limosa lapponica baueri]|uniref:Uncharacterized protein n=1 Tax=Limosa lapponica baueri TaxID=1758121 RepID=A0A2I0U3Y9_LIMLA|nr:hypothetical protein llap_8945 [Limosa lapponica baueri]
MSPHCSMYTSEDTMAMDKTVLQQERLKTSITMDKSVMQASAPLTGLWLIDKSVLEQEQEEDLNEMLNPIT